jgi:hypothetical protein
MDGTILGQGVFLANFNGLANPNPGNAESAQANNQIIAIPSAADWVAVRNFTQAGTAGNSAAYFNGTANAFTGVEYFWQRGMAPGSAFVKYYANGAAGFVGDRLVTGGFTIYDPSGQQAGSGPLVGAPVAVSAVTNSTRPAVTHTADSTVQVGSVVRLSNTAQTDVNGIDFVVGTVTDSTHFTLLTASNPLATAPGAIGGAGFYRVVNYPSLYYPRRRTVVNVTQAVNAQVSTSLEHSMTVGQSIRFNIPAVSGMVQLNPSSANAYRYATVVTIVDPYNFTIDIDTTAFTAFTWPTIAQEPCSIPTMEPIGENTAVGLAANNNVFPQYQGLPVFNANGDVFADATINTGYYGMILGQGGAGLLTAANVPILGPAGSISWSAGNVATPDQVYWVCGKAEFGGL